MNSEAKDLEFYKMLEGIKKVTRYQPFKELQENVAGHCYMTIVLAFDIMNKYNLKLNKEHVLEMLLYHDLPEIGMTFDFPADVVARTENMQAKKAELEQAKVENISETYSRKQIKKLFIEFETKKTREALFANLMDKLEAAIHIATNKCSGFKCNEDYEFIINYFAVYAKHFPELNKLISAVRNNLQQLYDEFKNKN